MTAEEKRVFPRRRLELVASMNRQRMSDAIDQWIVESSWTSPGGKTDRDRAWSCFRDWAIERKSRKPDGASAYPTLASELFDLVMESRFTIDGRPRHYSVTVSPEYVEKDAKPVPRQGKTRSRTATGANQVQRKR